MSHDDTSVELETDKVFARIEEDGVLLKYNKKKIYVQRDEDSWTAIEKVLKLLEIELETGD